MPHSVDELVTLLEHSESSCQTLSLAALHRRSVALQFAVGGRERVLCGQGEFGSDRGQGNVLRILLPPNAGCEIMIAEDRWDGEILPGKALGCDYLIRL